MKNNPYVRETFSRNIPICPNCGTRATETTTQYGIRNQCEPCGLWSWHRYPLVNAETHAARKAAHTAFDSLWRNGPLKRDEAYKQLSNALKIDKRNCHIKLMDRETANRVLEAIIQIKQTNNF